MKQYKTTEKQREYRKNYYKENRERVKKEVKEYRQNNKEAIRKTRNKVYRNSAIERINRLQRAKTRWFFGKLDEGYVYHHTTNPHDYTKFVILEKGLHSWMHSNPGSFKVGGLINN